MNYDASFCHHTITSDDLNIQQMQQAIVDWADARFAHP